MNQYLLRPYRITDGGVRWRMTKAQKLLAALVLAALALTAYGYQKLWPELQARFYQKWEPVAIKERLQRRQVPLGSGLEDSLVDWVRANSARPMAKPFARLLVNTVFDSASAEDVDPFLTLSIIKVESGFDYTAVSTAGALGLMQVLPTAHPEKLRGVQLFDPESNIRVGTRVLSEYMQWHDGDLRKALLQYNGSLGRSSSYSSNVLTVREQLLDQVALSLARHHSNP